MAQLVSIEEHKTLEQHLDEETIQALHRQASRRMRGHPDAEDVANQTLERLLRQQADGTGWKPPPPPTAWAHMLKTLQGVLKDFRRSWKRRTRTHDAVARENQEKELAPLRPEASDKCADLVDQMIGRLRKDRRGQIPLRILELTVAGVEDHEELAKRIGCAKKDLDNARKRIRQLARELLGLSAEPGAREEQAS